MVIQRPFDGSKQALPCHAVLERYLGGSCAVFQRWELLERFWGGSNAVFLRWDLFDLYADWFLWLRQKNDKRFENSLNNFAVHDSISEGHTYSERQIL